MEGDPDGLFAGLEFVGPIDLTSHEDSEQKEEANSNAIDRQSSQSHHHRTLPLGTGIPEHLSEPAAPGEPDVPADASDSLFSGLSLAEVPDGDEQETNAPEMATRALPHPVNISAQHSDTVSSAGSSPKSQHRPSTPEIRTTLQPTDSGLASSVARPPVVRKKRRSTRVGYARDSDPGDDNSSATPQATSGDPAIANQQSLGMLNLEDLYPKEQNQTGQHITQHQAEDQIHEKTASLAEVADKAASPLLESPEDVDRPVHGGGAFAAIQDPVSEKSDRQEESTPEKVSHAESPQPINIPVVEADNTEEPIESPEDVDEPVHGGTAFADAELVGGPSELEPGSAESRTDDTEPKVDEEESRPGETGSRPDETELEPNEADTAPDNLTIEERVKVVQERVNMELQKVKVEIEETMKKRKLAVQARRAASEAVATVAERKRELEEKLEKAVEEDDFEQAETISSEVASAESLSSEASHKLRAAEEHVDQALAELTLLAQRELEVELEGTAQLRALQAEGEEQAESLRQEAEANAKEEEERLAAEEEEAQDKRRKIALEQRVLEEEGSDLQAKIAEVTAGEQAEKKVLLSAMAELEAEAEALRQALREKEEQIAEQKVKVKDVDARIAAGSGKYEKQLLTWQKEQARVTAAFADVSASLEHLSSLRTTLTETLKDSLSQASSLLASSTLAAQASETLSTRAEQRQKEREKAEEGRRRREELAGKEKESLEKLEGLGGKVEEKRGEVAGAVNARLKVQQEVAVVRQRIEAAQKRLPELEANKKAAAAARNFKEAARLSSEAKALAADKEAAEADVRKLQAEVAAADATMAEVQAQLEALEAQVLELRKECAIARCERLRLAASAARMEVELAAEAEDFEEADSLQVEADAADAEADRLQEEFGLEAAPFDRHEVGEHHGPSHTGEGSPCDGGNVDVIHENSGA